MKKFLLTFIISILIAGNAFARRCLDGAIFEVDDSGQTQIVDCAKWERNPEAVLAEQQAIDNYTDEEIDFLNAVIERAEPDDTLFFGKVQNKIEDTCHDIYSAIFD